MKTLIALLVLLSPVAVHAQEADLPAQTVTPNAFVQDLNGARVRMMYDGIGDAFLFELQDRDLANQFNYGFPPAAQTLQGSDIMVVVRDDWATIESFWSNAGVEAAASAVRQYVGMGDGAPNLVVSELTAPDGHRVRFYNFVRFAMGEEQSERCMARAVIDNTYLGLDNSGFNAFECSRALR